MLSFENTEIAFKSKSDKELKRAHFLFMLIGKPGLVKIGKAATNTALKIGLPVKGIIRNTIFRQFCGGETIEDCDAKIAELHRFGVGTILDYSVEGKTEEKDFDATAQEIIRTIEKAHGNEAIPFAVFKVTGISRFGLLEKINDLSAELNTDEKMEFQRLLERVDSICKRGFELNVPVFIDAEETWIQDAIDRLAVSMMAKYNREKGLIYNTIQMYRHDRLEYLKKCIELARIGGYHYGIKLVRGAYMEKERARAEKMGYPSPIQPDKAACDNDYNSALEVILKNIDILTLCAGTHNEDSSLLLAKKIEEHGLEKNDSRIYFAQLLGMSDHISFNLADEGYKVAKYVPYGPIKEVMPYLFRRAEENTSVAGQTSRELGLLQKEKARRKI
ncbi:MAG: proline dehydrogenase family protein [Flavobacteriia bacterium]|nr:proline dehydrogenase family protein [Flavobacteriia bacterium]OJX37478.1 MAG: proline dehydrogenase [Flavobacteriia bacterium 40-80]